MRVIGLDVHRSFAQVAELEDGVLRNAAGWSWFATRCWRSRER